MLFAFKKLDCVYDEATQAIQSTARHYQIEDFAQQVKGFIKIESNN
jgi:hypothetical protein